MAFAEFKDRQAAAWGSAPFELISPTIASMHEALVDRLAPKPGERWLDVGCGTGDVAFLAARAGANVTASDLAPALAETARRQASEQGLTVEIDVADCESLPYDDASFDVVSSSVGAIFAPDHAQAARELARVCRPGGRLGLTAWTPAGRVGEFFRIVSGFAPPPPEGAGTPIQWGERDHARSLLGDAFELSFEELDAPYEAESGEVGWTTFLEGFGPLKTLAGTLPDERREELHREVVELFERDRDGDVIRQPRLYLLTLGLRR